MPEVFVLFEHPSGYALFQVKEAEEIGLITAQAEAASADLKKFNSLVNLVAYQPFKTSIGALENCNGISESVVHDELRTFLENNLPKTNVILGVAYSKLADSVHDSLQIKATASGAVPEIIRAIRLHFPRLIKGLSNQAENKAQIGLGHSYSRAKIKFNVNRADNMIIQSINLLDQLDKDINTFCMRVREWYGYHFPELVKLVPDNPTYVKVASLMGNRKQFIAEWTDESREQLETIMSDAAKAEAIIDAAKSSMGMDVSDVDLSQIRYFASRINSMIDRRRRLHSYLIDKMDNVAPNLSTLMGEQVAARLIAHAGSLTNLAKFPASTVQILGAEKALFRALKTRGNTPKYGLIFHSTFIGKAGKEHKGRVSRYLASKATIATRIDAFSDCPTNVFGSHLRQQVEDRLSYLSSGENPPKNADVMTKAVEEAAVAATKLLKKQKKKEKKKRKEKERLTAESEVKMDVTEDGGEQVVKKEKKKRKEVKSEPVEEPLLIMPNGDASSKKKKKQKKTEEDSVVAPTADGDASSKKKKRKHQTSENGPSNEEAQVETTIPSKKKKRKTVEPDAIEEATRPKKMKKSKLSL